MSAAQHHAPGSVWADPERAWSFIADRLDRLDGGVTAVLRCAKEDAGDREVWQFIAGGLDHHAAELRKEVRLALGLPPEGAATEAAS